MKLLNRSYIRRMFLHITFKRPDQISNERLLLTESVFDELETDSHKFLSRLYNVRNSVSTESFWIKERYVFFKFLHCFYHFFLPGKTWLALNSSSTRNKASSLSSLPFNVRVLFDGTPAYKSLMLNKKTLRRILIHDLAKNYGESINEQCFYRTTTSTPAALNIP